jgi:hypothetical protein
MMNSSGSGFNVYDITYRQKRERVISLLVQGNLTYTVVVSLYVIAPTPEKQMKQNCVWGLLIQERGAVKYNRRKRINGVWNTG